MVDKNANASQEVSLAARPGAGRGGQYMDSDQRLSSEERAPETLVPDQEVARLVARLNTALMLRSILIASRPFGGDIVLMTVAWAIWVANVAHIDHPHQQMDRYLGLDADVPNDLRRPISVLALANSLNLPYETTRRHVKRLQRAGICERRRAGVIILQSALNSADDHAGMLSTVANVRRLCRDLRRLLPEATRLQKDLPELI